MIAIFFLLSPAITTLPMMPKELGGKRWRRSQRMGYGAFIVAVIPLVVKRKVTMEKQQLKKERDAEKSQY